MPASRRYLDPNFTMETTDFTDDTDGINATATGMANSIREWIANDSLKFATDDSTDHNWKLV